MTLIFPTPQHVCAPPMREDSDIHPAGPVGSTWDCPECSQVWEVAARPEEFGTVTYVDQWVRASRAARRRHRAAADTAHRTGRWDWVGKAFAALFWTFVIVAAGFGCQVSARQQHEERAHDRECVESYADTPLSDVPIDCVSAFDP